MAKKARKTRDCLKCGKGFLSGGNGNRLCPHCNTENRTQRIVVADVKHPKGRRVIKRVLGAEGMDMGHDWRQG